MRIAYLGPEGTFTHAAACRLFPVEELVSEGTIDAVFEAVESGRADRGVVPVENSTEGAVTYTADALVDGAARACAELVLEVRQALLARSGTVLATIARVASHPQALAQCRAFLGRELPAAALVPEPSTAAAARAVRDGDADAAIAPAFAAELYGLAVLRDGVQDRAGNQTRFFAIAREDAPPTGADKTSIAFVVRHERGALRKALTVLEEAGLNLTRIESRPAARRDRSRWEYVFLADLEGHRTDPAVASALDALDAACELVKVLGSYPKGA